MEYEFVSEMWEFTFFFKGQGKTRSYATLFSIFCWHAFKASHSWTSAVRCWKTSEDCQGHSSDKSEPGWNDSFNF